jgi:D-serine deaminase-like pyridoxal phosphate-dependent protein
VSKTLRQLKLDCGALALSKDTLRDGTFGRVVGHPDWKLVSLSQEMAIVKGLSDKDLEDPTSPGKCVKVWMPHCCLSAACFEEYFVVNCETGDEESWKEADPVVSEVWRPNKGW